MDGYSIQEAAEVLGVPKRRIRELVARGVILGSQEDDGELRVFLQPRPPAFLQPPPDPEPGFEASPFRELLTEFRNLTERYGQALLALGESRGEVAALRGRVEALETRVDLRLGSSATPSVVEWHAPPPVFEAETLADLLGDEAAAEDAIAAEVATDATHAVMTEGEAAEVAGEATQEEQPAAESELAAPESLPEAGGAPQEVESIADLEVPAQEVEPVAEVELPVEEAESIVEAEPSEPVETVEPDLVVEAGMAASTDELAAEAASDEAKPSRSRRSGFAAAGIAEALARAVDPSTAELPAPAGSLEPSIGEVDETAEEVALEEDAGPPIDESRYSAEVEEPDWLAEGDYTWLEAAQREVEPADALPATEEPVEPEIEPAAELEPVEPEIELEPVAEAELAEPVAEAAIEPDAEREPLEPMTDVSDGGPWSDSVGWAEPDMAQIETMPAAEAGEETAQPDAPWVETATEEEDGASEVEAAPAEAAELVEEPELEPEAPQAAIEPEPRLGWAASRVLRSIPVSGSRSSAQAPAPTEPEEIEAPPDVAPPDVAEEPRLDVTPAPEAASEPAEPALDANIQPAARGPVWDHDWDFGASDFAAAAATPEVLEEPAPGSEGEGMADGAGDRAEDVAEAGEGEDAGQSEQADDAGEVALMWLGSEFDEGEDFAAEIEVGTAGWHRPPPPAAPDELTRMAADQGWDENEVDAIRNLLEPPSHEADRSSRDETPQQTTVDQAPEAAPPPPSADRAPRPVVPEWPSADHSVTFNLPGGDELRRALNALGEPIERRAPEPPEVAERPAPRQWSKDDQQQAQKSPQPAAASEPPPPPATPPAQPAEPERAAGAAAGYATSTTGEPEWLRGRRDPAARAYRRLRRIFPG